MGIENVAETRYESKEKEKSEVQNEKHDGNSPKPHTIVGQLMQQERQDPNAHRNGEPSVMYQLSASSLPL